MKRTNKLKRYFKLLRRRKHGKRGNDDSYLNTIIRWQKWCCHPNSKETPTEALKWAKMEWWQRKMGRL